MKRKSMQMIALATLALVILSQMIHPILAFAEGISTQSPIEQFKTKYKFEFKTVPPITKINSEQSTKKQPIYGSPNDKACTTAYIELEYAMTFLKAVESKRLERTVVKRQMCVPASISSTPRSCISALMKSFRDSTIASASSRIVCHSLSCSTLEMIMFWSHMIDTFLSSMSVCAVCLATCT